MQYYATYLSVWKLAEQMFSIPATSAPVEWVVSTGGNIINKKRASLTADNDNLLIFLKENSEFMDWQENSKENGNAPAVMPSVNKYLLHFNLLYLCHFSHALSSPYFVDFNHESRRKTFNLRQSKNESIIFVVADEANL